MNTFTIICARRKCLVKNRIPKVIKGSFVGGLLEDIKEFKTRFI
jgi:hypothetical protein